MKLVFAGPSIAHLPPHASDIVICPPAIFGDVEAAVARGANVIGLVDGRFQQVAAVWHKEILLALSLGVQVLGAASMGALRAAECEAFGMVPVGLIAKRYASGELFDDGDVALLHAPGELGYRAATEPLVNVIATAECLLSEGAAEPVDARALLAFARSLHFSERSLDRMFARESPLAYLADRYMKFRVDQKALDANLLLDAVAALPDQRRPPPEGWRLLHSRFWEERRLTAD